MQEQTAVEQAAHTPFSAPVAVHDLENGRFSLVANGPIAYSDDRDMLERLAETVNSHADLLAACKLFADSYPDWCECVDNAPTGHCAMCVIRAAIRRAEGSEQ